MRVENHVLIEADAKFEKTSPNKSAGIQQKFLLIHYTAGVSAESSVAWLCNPQAKASAHLVIGRDGSIAQLVRFDERAWHAGESQWGLLKGLNQYSIGIELDNEGLLTRRGDGKWVFGKTVIADDQVILAPHRLDPAAVQRGWKAYPQVQLDVLQEVAAALHAAYQFEAILGHDDVAWPRKSDPGPAFPMETLRARIFGRA